MNEERLPLAGLLALSTAAFTTIITELLPAGVLPAMSATLHVSAARIGMLVSAYAITSAIVAIPAISATRGLPRKPLLMMTLAGFALMNGVTAVSSSYGLTVLARIVAGAFAGLVWPLVIGYAARLVSPANAGRAVAVALAGSTVAMSVGVPAGTVLGQFIGWRGAFGVLSLLAVALVAWVSWAIPPSPGQQSGDRLPLLTVARLPGLGLILAATGLTILAHYALYIYMAPLSTALALKGGAGFALFLFGVGSFVGIAIVGRLVDAHLRRVAISAFALTVVSMLMLGIGGSVPGVSPAAIFLWGVSFGGAPTFFQAATVRVAGKAAEVATSAVTTVYNTGIFAGAFLGGVILEAAGVRLLPWTVLAMIVLALTIVLAGRRFAFPPSGGRAPAIPIADGLLQPVTE
jgi:predicted MFS family arabinose efflux permease